MKFISIFTVFSSLVILAFPSLAREDFVQFDGKWRYLNGDEVPPATWKDQDFDDSNWKVGRAPIGYGNYQLRTVVHSQKSPRPITTYFRSSFMIDDPGNWEKLLLRYKADDGAVVYLNGRHISSFNMPNPPYDETTTASRTIRGWVPYRNHDVSSWIPHLVKGKNTIAVSGHQVNPKSSDLQLVFKMTGIEKGIKSRKMMDLESMWKYSDQRQLPDDEWMELDYDDSGWKRGKGVFGYGNDDVTTVLDFGDDPNDKPISGWFRSEFVVEDDMDVRAILMKVRFDDAITIFLNGREVQKHNLPFGYSDHQTPARKEFNDWSNNHPHSYNFPAKGIQLGRNLIAIQIHGSGPRSPDMCMAMVSLKLEYLPKKLTAPVIAKIEPAQEKALKLIKVSNAGEVAGASPSAWAYSSEKYLNIALGLYEKEKLDPARRAYGAAKLAQIFSAKGYSLAPQIKYFLLAEENLETALEYLDLFSSLDDHDEVYRILNLLFTESKESFMAYPNLALAIALVYDQAPPRGWPHHQVSDTILPRRLPDPVEAFQFWSSSDQAGKTLHPLADLGIGELKYVVDSPATLEELAGAQKLRVRLSSLRSLYPGIKYDHDRLKTQRYDWPFQTYTLEDIKERGGICVDQAYYTAQVAKAYGVPAMLLSGAGSNGNHAWVGFLDRREQWDFETGRYEESKYVTGLAFDPQTWQQPTDHEISLLTERFQRSPRYRISRVHTVFAEAYLKQDKITEAIKAGRLAIKSESRNFAAWEVLIKALKKGKSPASELQETYSDGAKTFGRVADLEAHFLKRLATSLNAEGKTVESKKVRDRVISRNRRERPDIALEESKDRLNTLIAESPVEEQLAFYKRQIQLLKDAGLVTYYALTQPFLEHLTNQDHLDEAKEALDYTRRRMEVREGGQLDEELRNWAGRIGE